MAFQNRASLTADSTQLVIRPRKRREVGRKDVHKRRLGEPSGGHKLLRLFGPQPEDFSVVLPDRLSDPLPASTLVPCARGTPNAIAERRSAAWEAVRGRRSSGACAGRGAACRRALTGKMSASGTPDACQASASEMSAGESTSPFRSRVNSSAIASMYSLPVMNASAGWWPGPASPAVFGRTRQPTGPAA